MELSLIRTHEMEISVPGLKSVATNRTEAHPITGTHRDWIRCMIDMCYVLRGRLKKETVSDKDYVRFNDE